MKAVALTHYLPIDDPQSLQDVTLTIPVPTGCDLLVSVKAIAVNPVDTKIRAPKANIEAQPRVLGWDACGVVHAVGADVNLFQVGDEVYYAGDITRQGCNAEFQLVDERIVGRKPFTLSFGEAAALPLTAITAWEALFERAGIDPYGTNKGQTLLIIGGAGGVGSIAIQLAKLAGLVVLTTASRPETREWVESMGADFVLDHRHALPPQLAACGYKTVDIIANFNNTDTYWTMMAELIRPQGTIVAIVENTAPLDLNLLKSKSVTFVWEFMFTRTLYQTMDMHKQGEMLNTIATWIDGNKLHTTVTQILSPISAANLRKAHAQLESKQSIGKIVLEGF